MNTFYQGQEISASNPLLVWATAGSDSILVEPDSISYSISWYNEDADSYELVFPALDLEELDLTANLLTTGRYALPWEIDEDAETGLYKLHVEWSLDGVTTLKADRDIEVLSSDFGFDGRHSCLVQDLRDEGITVSTLSNRRAAQLINRASRNIEQWTGRHFYPDYRVLKIDSIARMKSLEIPSVIACIEKLEFVDDIYYEPATILDDDDYKVYARHLTENLINPDDRLDSRLGFEGRIQTRANQAAEVTGIFGYTDYDGSSDGKTPDDIRRLATLLVIRDLPILSEEDDTNKKSPFVTNEKTSKQSVSFSDKVIGFNGFYVTGDPEIDEILSRYRMGFAVKGI